MALLNLGSAGTATLQQSQNAVAGRPLDSLPNLRSIISNEEQDCADLLRIIERLETMSQMLAGKEILETLPPPAPANPLKDEGALNVINHLQCANHERIIRIDMLVSAMHTRLQG